MTLTQWSKFLLKQVLPLTVMVITSTWTIVEIVKSLRFRKQINSQRSEKSVQCFGVTIGVIVLFIVTNAPLAFFVFDTSINGARFKPSFTETVRLLLCRKKKRQGYVTTMTSLQDRSIADEKNKEVTCDMT
ncbi:hypothetical protein CAPTEDRAFT_191014 [Capitella teleta]|uniref:G-protein coupled receptors family 1 profile domain-containing protein n=1 Tax=Capitella teleta TaxID=283909 RepID=R7UJ07_CAPTE|nr:hypothetical protein CAPTEDRAFT_191014 [Capitella teleta]|eukprot:ELU06175.1 hypothetical protein CAPTEDRAFT_191014 [Capitella teleta]